jgi:protein-tyrosine phosphatase
MASPQISQDRLLPRHSAGLYSFLDIVNLRDLASIDPMHLRPNVVFRSAVPSLASVEDRRLLEALGIRQVVDLRSADEIERLPTIQAPWLTVHQVPLVAGQWNTSDLDLVPIPEYLGRQYRAMLEQRHVQIVEALTHIAAGQGATLVHCTAGKDRTGVLIAVLATILAVPQTQIVADYAESAVHMPQLFRQLQAAGLDAPHRTISATEIELLFAAPPAAIEALLSTIGPFPHRLFDEIGITHDLRRALRDRLMLHSEPLSA